MDKKLDYANILIINEDEEEDNEEESKKDMIDTLIKDIDLKKNYNLRYNFYNNFIKMYKKNSKIIKLIYKKFNEVKEINEKEKVLYDKLKYAMSTSSASPTSGTSVASATKGGGKIRSPDDILNEKIIKIINEIKIAEFKNVRNNKILYKKLENLIIDTYGNNISKDNVNNIVKKLMRGGEGENNIADDEVEKTVVENIPNSTVTDTDKIKKLITNIVDKLKQKDNKEIEIKDSLKKNIDSLLRSLVEEKIIKPREGLKNSETQTTEAILSNIQTNTDPYRPSRSSRPSRQYSDQLDPSGPSGPSGPSDMQEISSILRQSRPQRLSARIDPKLSEDNQYEELMNSAKIRSNYANRHQADDSSNEDENHDPRKEKNSYSPSNQYSDRKTYMGIVKAIQKNYEFKNLTNINNKYSIDGNNKDYNNYILNFNKAIDDYNELDDDMDEKGKKIELKNIKNKLLSFENNPNNYYKNTELTFEDRFVFIITTFFIRYISLILVQWCVDINIIKSFEEGFIYYAVIYVAIFWFIILFINIDNGFKVDYMNLSNAMNSIRSLFYYFYMGTNGITRLIVHSCIIFILIIVPVILNIKKKNNYSEEDGEEKFENIISYEDRKKLTKSLSLFTIYLWILTSIIATKF
jgi:hypothetical protein